jgi:nickel-dependent lactate racemase
VKINFPYPDTEPLEIPPGLGTQVFALPDVTPEITGIEAVKNALESPIGFKRLSKLACGVKKILIVADDITRPTPICKFIHLVLDELALAGAKDEHIEFIMALGTHRGMTKDEIAAKLGTDVAGKYKIHNHDWKNPDCLEYVGDTEQGVPVWINKLVSGADLVIGIGSIMPIEVCGFTGGGKILVPGVCGQITCDEMHWTRIDVPSKHVLGKAENPVRASIDSLARKAGLDFIVNVILNSENKIIGAVAGDMVTAHRAGCEIALKVFGVNIPKEFDVVIADSFPFDIEFWQANKALDTAGEVVKKGGVVILVSPCYEGFSRTHNEILEFGYLPIETIKNLVKSGRIKHKVVGVHMIQAGSVAIEKAKLILVSTGIKKNEAEKVGFLWAQNAQGAFSKALEIVGKNPSIAVLKNAARMLPLVKRTGD